MKPPEFREGEKLFSSEIIKPSENDKLKKFERIIPKEKTLDELEKITEIRNTLQEKIGGELLQEKDMMENLNHQETIVIEGREIIVEYIPRGEIYPAFGYGGGDKAVVREDLSPRVKKFVRAHEIYHCLDKAEWGGWIGREIRANVVPGLKDPIGLMATIWATISDIDRIKFYLKRIKNKH